MKISVSVDVVKNSAKNVLSLFINMLRLSTAVADVVLLHNAVLVHVVFRNPGFAKFS